MSTKLKLVLVIAVIALAYVVFSGDTEPVEVDLDE